MKQSLRLGGAVVSLACFALGCSDPAFPTDTYSNGIPGSHAGSDDIHIDAGPADPPSGEDASTLPDEGTTSSDSGPAGDSGAMDSGRGSDAASTDAGHDGGSARDAARDTGYCHHRGCN